MKLNLGCSDRHLPGWINVDRVAPADQIVDLAGPWPWPDDSIDEVIAADIFEHLPDKIHTLNELWRVLKIGGTAQVIVPSTDGRGAFQDPTHTSYWNLNSWKYAQKGDPHNTRFRKAYGMRHAFDVCCWDEDAGDHVIKTTAGLVKVEL
jgi:predicted SAM-dependent methyltransferase